MTSTSCITCEDLPTIGWRNTARPPSELTNAIRIKGNDWTDFSQLGIANYHLNRHDDAIQALQKALALKPGHTATTEFIAKSYFKKGVAALSAKQYDQAIDLFGKARENNPKDGFIYYNLGEAYLFKNNTAEAEKALSQGAGAHAQKRRGLPAHRPGL